MASWPVLFLVLVHLEGLSMGKSQLRVLHTNDVHAHLDEFNIGGTDCNDVQRQANKCYGGIARIRTAVDSLRKGNESTTVFFDAGDQFQGTMFFNMYKGEKISEFMNAIEYDLMCIGNHEFDSGEEVLYNFFRTLHFPIVSSNIDFSTTNFLHRIVQPYVVLEQHNVGIIGFITNTTSFITNGARDIHFFDPVEPVQRAIDELHRRGIKKIIAVSHNGYDDDMYLASRTRGLNLIVGGHSHSLLLNQQGPGVVGRYPTAVVTMDGETTYVVQAHRYGDYLGNVLVTWDEYGKLLSVEGDPILLDNAIAKDAEFASNVAKWRLGFDSVTNEIIALSNGSFAGWCKGAESCPMAELVTDAMLDGRRALGSQMAFTNAGGIRAQFMSGNVTYGAAVSVLPFGNLLVDIELTGAAIMTILESGAALVPISPARWAGLRYTMTMSKARFSRISNVSVISDRTGNTLWAPLNLQTSYRVTTNNFVVSGGDNIMPAVKSFVTNDMMLDGFVAYLRSKKIITPSNDDRVHVVP